MSNLTTTDQQYSLINGEFSAKEAQELLMHLICKKINFHESRNWSHQERFGEQNEASVKRIKELEASKAQIQEVVQQAQQAGKSVRIRSNIHLEITE
jgi:hypothetical protein